MRLLNSALLALRCVHDPARAEKLASSPPLTHPSTPTRISKLTLQPPHSALPISLAQHWRHYRPPFTTVIPSLTSASTVTTTTSFTNATVPMTTTSAASSSAGVAGDTACPTITLFAPKKGVCPVAECEAPPVHTSTFSVGCGCPVATPTTTSSRCVEGCYTSTTTLYSTASGC